MCGIWALASNTLTNCLRVCADASPDGRCLALQERLRKEKGKKVWRERFLVLGGFDRIVQALMQGDTEPSPEDRSGAAAIEGGMQVQKCMGYDAWVVNKVDAMEEDCRKGGWEDEEERCLAFFWSPDSSKVVLCSSFAHF